MTQTLSLKMGKSEYVSCLYCKEKDTQVHALLYCPSTIQFWSNAEKWLRNGIQPYYKMSDWDKVQVILLNECYYSLHKIIIYMNRQTGKEMPCLSTT